MRSLLPFRRRTGRRPVSSAYLYRSDTAFVDLSQPTGRKRFIHTHEEGSGLRRSVANPIGRHLKLDRDLVVQEEAER
jgi:hypothetical protein